MTLTTWPNTQPYQSYYHSGQYALKLKPTFLATCSELNLFILMEIYF